MENDHLWGVSTGREKCIEMVVHQRILDMFLNHHHHLKDMNLDVMVCQGMQHQCRMVQCHCSGNYLNNKYEVLMVKLLRP